MSLTAEDFARFLRRPDADIDVPLGAALSDLAVDADLDAAAAVRDLREDV